MPALIEVSGIEKVFHVGDTRVAALGGITTTIDAGAFVAIMGPSGSGKSTFMNILGCLDRPSAGVYRLDGVDVSTLSADQQAELRNRDLGFVFQSYNLIPRMTAAENVEMPLYYGDLPLARHARRAAEAMEAVGLGARASHLPNQLSGGEQQRVAIARSLVGRPRLLLADEPTGNLDSATSRDIMSIFTRLNRERGITVVLVTHEEEIAAYAGRVLTFRDGRVVGDRETGPDGAKAGARLAASMS